MATAVCFYHMYHSTCHLKIFCEICGGKKPLLISIMRSSISVNKKQASHTLVAHACNINSHLLVFGSWMPCCLTSCQMPCLLGKRSSPFALKILLSLNSFYSFVSLGVPFKLNTLLLTFFFNYFSPFCSCIKSSSWTGCPFVMD